MANISHLFSPNFIHIPTTSTKHFFTSRRHKYNRDFSVLSMASSSIPLTNVEYIEREFKSEGVSFTGIGNSYVVKMRLENGSVASLMVPSGLITSYKAHMWHGSTMEFLHTNVLEREDGSVCVQGGMSMDLKCGIKGEDSSWSPRTWVLHDVKGDSEESIQVELRCRDSDNRVEFRNTVTLKPDVLSSDVLISNLQSSPLELTGSILSHLTVSTPDATYAVGLEGSDYYSKSPFISNFSIIPPEISENKTKGVFQGLFSSWGAKSESSVEEVEEESEGEEKDNYKHLTEEMSRIYTSAPREYTLIDRGRRNSVAVGSNGFEELYIFSPGSMHDWYGKFSFVCTGPSAMLKPIVLEAKGEWRGRQYLHNPSL